MLINRIFSVLGIIVIFVILWLISENKKSFPWRIVIVGVIVQFLLAIFIFNVPIGFKIFQWMGAQVEAFLNFGKEGGRFIFGNALSPEQTAVFGIQFGILLISVIVFFSAVVSLLYHFGIIQRVIYGIAWMMQKTMGTSGTESLSAAANIFLGLAEAPLLVRHYLHSASRSELNAIMVGGFASIAGTVMAAYIQMGIDPMLLIAASIISAPGGLILAKVVVPPSGNELSLQEIKSTVITREKNTLMAITKGASDGMKLAITVIAMLIAFVSLIAFSDAILSVIHDALTHIGFYFFPEDLKELFGIIFQPFAYIVGIPAEEAKVFGSLLGTKVTVNEFIAYADLSALIEAGKLSERTIKISTLALCGFANFGSIAIQIGAFNTLIPERKDEVSNLGLRAMLIGALANLLTAAIAGIII